MTRGLAIETRGLVKRFGSRLVAVDGLDLAIAEGETYGLLGPNGAGKTTALRVLMGLVRPTSGFVRVLNKRPGDPATLARVGSMGESGFYPFLSGRDNLRSIARRSGTSDARVDEVLERVAMSARSRDLFSHYSLGMKQRLGVAAGLLKDPQLLFLDEPSNGLDPAGQLAIRELVREVAQAGRTVVLCSHDMDEVEALCGRIGLIAGGKMLAEGTPEELRGKPQFWLEVQPLDKSAAVAFEAFGAERVEVYDGLLHIQVGADTPSADRGGHPSINQSGTHN